MIYTVDEVSDLLSIPRPTLYRYLREYSIPHVRRSGKISIPEESFDRIKEARELHREGLATSSVRRRLREGGGSADSEELAEQLDRLSGTLERLQGNLGVGDGAPSLPQETLDDILQKQELLLSSVSNLTEMVEKLLSTDLQNRAAARSGVAAGARRWHTVPELSSGADSLLGEEEPQGQVQTVQREPAADESATEDLSESIGYPATPIRREKFGTLSRRRRRMILALLLVLLASGVLVWGAPAVGDRLFGQPAATDEQSAAEESQGASEALEEGEPATDSQIVEVPNLKGKSLPEAEDALAGAGLKLGEWNQIPDYEIPAGLVVVQGPQAGEEADQGTPVDLIVSSGPPVGQPGVTGSQPGAADSNVGNGMGVDQYPGGDIRRQNEGILPPAPVQP